MFDDGCDRIIEAMDAIGMSCYTHFNKLFQKTVGLSPSEYIKSKTKEVKYDSTV